MPAKEKSVDLTELIYDKSRYKDKLHVPNVIYIGRKEIMLKMMRACIGITDINQLWF